MQYTNIGDEDKTKDQLIGELADLRHLIAELERSEAERKGAEKELRESEERFRKLSEASFEGIAMAAQVAWVNESSGRVHINGGKNDGYELGAIVCFFISSR